MLSNLKGAGDDMSRKLKIILVIISVFGIVTCFFPYVTFMTKNQIVTVTSFDIISRFGFYASSSSKSGIIAFPVLMKIIILVSALLKLLGIIFVLINKHKAAAGAFLVSSVMHVFSILSLNSIRSEMVDLNISQAAVKAQLGFVLVVAIGMVSAILAMAIIGKEKLIESILFVCAMASIAIVGTMTLYVIISGTPAIAEIGPGRFIFGTSWIPNKDTYGISAMILSSLGATAGAILMGVPIGVFTAIFLSEIANKKLAGFIHPAIELLAGIPSVIYGFFGMIIVVPMVKSIGEFLRIDTKGDSLLAAIIILAIMVLPTIVSVSESSLRAVPVSYKEASTALGASDISTIFKVILPSARNGVLSGVILGIGRAIGETMAVIMVAGNIVNMPSIFGSVRFLTTGIALELSYSSGLHRQALFAIGLVLFVFIAVIDIIFARVSVKGVKINES